jgi:hypothetical protein
MNKDKPNVDRQELYRLVWSEPISKLASSFYVSGSYLARMCRDLDVPTPPRGYWAQIKAGKMPKKTALPIRKPGTPSVWIRSASSSIPTDIRPIPPEPREEIPALRRKTVSHGLLEDAKDIFAKSKVSYSSVFLSPRHRKVVDILTTQKSLEKTIAFAQRLFSRLKDYSYQVTLANHEDSFRKPDVDEEEIPRDKKNDQYRTFPWRPSPCTVAYFGTVAVGLTIVEMTMRVKLPGWYSEKSEGSGRYRLYAYSPYRHTSLIRSWQDTKEQPLAGRFDEIISDMESMARSIPGLIEEGERLAQIEQERREAEWKAYQRKQDLESRERVRKESQESLEELINSWAILKSQRAFLEELAGAIDAVAPEIRESLLGKLKEAQSLLEGKTVVDIIKSWKTPEERYAALPSWLKYKEE